MVTLFSSVKWPLDPVKDYGEEVHRLVNSFSPKIRLLEAMVNMADKMES